jgi:hypothetical protein
LRQDPNDAFTYARGALVLKFTIVLAKLAGFANKLMKQSLATNGFLVRREGCFQGTPKVSDPVFQIRHRRI